MQHCWALERGCHRSTRVPLIFFVSRKTCTSWAMNVYHHVMSVWTADVKVPRPAFRVIAALIAGAVVTLLEWCLLRLLLHPLGFPPPNPGWLLVSVWVALSSYVPMYVTVWVYWTTTPDRTRSAWARNAGLIAAAAGAVLDVALGVLLMPSRLAPMPAVVMSFAVHFGLVRVVAIWLFVRLRPGDEGGPIWRWRQRRRVEAGLCTACGYDLTGLPEPRCPECATEFDPATLSRELGVDGEDA